MNVKVVVRRPVSARAGGCVFIHKSVRRLAIAAVVGLSTISAGSALAGTFTYTSPEATNTSGAPDNWSGGTAAGWDATPVSATDTTLVFNGPTTAANRFTANDV